jgi:hypothetical protein
VLRSSVVLRNFFGRPACSRGRGSGSSGRRRASVETARPAALGKVSAHRPFRSDQLVGVPVTGPAGRADDSLSESEPELRPSRGMAGSSSEPSPSPFETVLLLA